MRNHLLFFSSLAVVALSASTASARGNEWRPGDPPPPGFHVEEQTRVGAIVGGSIMFGLPYAGSIAAATAFVASGSSGVAPLYIPLAGPWITLGTAFQSDGCCGFAAAGVLGGIALVADGALQAAGAIWLIHGLASKKTTLVYDGARAARVTVTPYATPSGGGLAVFGTF